MSRDVQVVLEGATSELVDSKVPRSSSHFGEELPFFYYRQA